RPLCRKFSAKKRRHLRRSFKSRFPAVRCNIRDRYAKGQTNRYFAIKAKSVRLPPAIPPLAFSDGEIRRRRSGLGAGRGEDGCTAKCPELEDEEAHRRGESGDDQRRR